MQMKGVVNMQKMQPHNLHYNTVEVTMHMCRLVAVSDLKFANNNFCRNSNICQTFTLNTYTHKYTSLHP